MKKTYLSELNQPNEASHENYNCKTKHLTFRDWKSLKDNQKISNDKLKNKCNGKLNAKPTVNSKHLFHTNSDIRNRLNCVQNCSSSSYLCFLSFNHSNEINFNYYNIHGNNWGPINHCVNNFNALNFNCTSTSFDDYNVITKFKISKVPNKFTNSKELQKCFRKDQYGYDNSNRDINFIHSENFFTSDFVYLQLNMMQKPLPKPFLNSDKDIHLIQEFGKPRYAKDDKRIKNNKNPNQIENLFKKSHSTVSADAKEKYKESELYVTNPKAVLGGKPYIPKPKIPAQNSELTHEEKKLQWKEYRQAMKPYKNRDFHNAKRVVQRLGKKGTNELDEKELIRLKNAQEYMTGHKARLNAKYPNYVKAEDNCNELGELYILKNRPVK